jgi:hypothetical protein
MQTQPQNSTKENLQQLYDYLVDEGNKLTSQISAAEKESKDVKPLLEKVQSINELRKKVSQKLRPEPVYLRVNCLFNGYASLQDYQVAQVIESGSDLVILCRQDSMRILNEFIFKEGKRTNHKLINKYGPTLSYSLVDFRFVPDKFNDFQSSLFQGIELIENTRLRHRKEKDLEGSKLLVSFLWR